MRPAVRRPFVSLLQRGSSSMNASSPTVSKAAWKLPLLLQLQQRNKGSDPLDGCGERSVGFPNLERARPYRTSPAAVHRGLVRTPPSGIGCSHHV